MSAMRRAAAERHKDQRCCHSFCAGDYEKQSEKSSIEKKNEEKGESPYYLNVEIHVTEYQVAVSEQ